MGNHPHHPSQNSRGHDGHLTHALARMLGETLASSSYYPVKSACCADRTWPTPPCRTHPTTVSLSHPVPSPLYVPLSHEHLDRGQVSGNACARRPDLVAVKRRPPAGCVVPYDERCLDIDGFLPSSPNQCPPKFFRKHRTSKRLLLNPPRSHHSHLSRPGAMRSNVGASFTSSSYTAPDLTRWEWAFLG